jgi:hypothetical protein
MNQMASMSGMHVDHSRGSIAGRAGRFVLHLLEMCAPMCLGLVVFDLLLVFAVGPMMGYPDPLRQLPDQFQDRATHAPTGGERRGHAMGAPRALARIA